MAVVNQRSNATPSPSSSSNHHYLNQTQYIYLMDQQFPLSFKLNQLEGELVGVLLVMERRGRSRKSGSSGSSSSSLSSTTEVNFNPNPNRNNQLMIQPYRVYMHNHRLALLTTRKSLWWWCGCGKDDDASITVSQQPASSLHQLIVSTNDKIWYKLILFYPDQLMPYSYLLPVASIDEYTTMLLPK